MRVQHTFVQFSTILDDYLHKKKPSKYTDYIQSSVQSAYAQNPWFIERFVETMLSHIVQLTSKESIEKYAAGFSSISSPQNIMVIAAGNIPMVSFHDVITVLLSGHRLLFKPSSKDTVLMNMIISILQDLNTSLKEKIIIQEKTLTDKNIHAVIATGSNNTAHLLNQYFSKYPRIIRNNRTSIAIIDDTTSDEELNKLADDILLYFGLGCRNVSKIFIPKNFDIQRIFKAIYNYGFVMQHHKYMNNYDYYRSIYLLNKEAFLENNFLILKESPQLHAPVASVFYQTYQHFSDITSYIEQNKNELQTIIGKNYTPFGQSQFPDITEFADGINTIEFLNNL